ncbi:DUF1178 family protein [Tranquillimonas alkanivorans]|uniref:Uncharacterized protein n=1 Tax=Tranquillimonas alkanivorans TaxID=441119 RepID=A0A1I5M793_9RHOB|nr:DUF1178 family protein [Tranquillimonas alkanivorans]SFP05409.1 hypothetical protein SAMN04488047_102131 [Tranquillimonas alkanivorans]
MIRYTLKCRDDHVFESWFQSASAYDALRSAGHVACPECGGTEVEKSLMAPQVQASRKKAQASEQKAPSLREPASPAEKALAELKKKVESNSEYVGMKFAAEARKMHEGGAPERSIYGEARIDEAKKLIEDGIPVAPLPFRPARKSN